MRAGFSRRRLLPTAVLLLAGGALGVAAWSAFAVGMSWTNTESFCISCHEIRTFVYEPSLGTIHDVNRIGVRATCVDCHVPRPLGPLLFAKLRASKDLYHHLMGTIDTQEKFEARHLLMAERVWDSMQANDSRECRFCHNDQAMALDEQTGRARRQHEGMIESGETCIDCHKGLAHDLPYDYDGF